MIDVMAIACGYRNLNDFVAACAKPLSPQVINLIDNAIKNCKVRYTVLGQYRKCKSESPCLFMTIQSIIYQFLQRFRSCSQQSRFFV